MYVHAETDEGHDPPMTEKDIKLLKKKREETPRTNRSIAENLSIIQQNVAQYATKGCVDDLSFSST